ncbi:HlyD family secretion protein [Pelagibacterium sp.]|uniref:HlyD family secretion protein n=1 Tax=Pelagibacterium sp. TaxID=1967288 RepID=UPI003A950E07
MAQAAPHNDDKIQSELTSSGSVAPFRSEMSREVTQAPQPADTASEPVPPRSRRKARLFGLGILVALGACIAWYPLSDHHAPYSGGGSLVGDVTQIAARVSGPVSQVLVTDNSEVREGQPLFHIDETTFLMDVAQASAQLDQTTASISSAGAAIPTARAKVEQAEVGLANAQETLDRTLQLFDRELTSTAQLSQVQANFDTAELNVTAARAELERVTASAGPLDDTNPNIRAAQAGLEKARFGLDNATVRAPADGYVTNLSLTPGQFVGAGSPVMTFISEGRDTVIADYRENQLVNVSPGDRAIVIFEAAPGRQFEGTVDSIAWGISNGRVSSNGLAQSSTDSRWFPPARKIPVRIVIDDPDALPANVRLGSEAGALIVPDQGLIPAIAQSLLGVRGMISGFN